MDESIVRGGRVAPGAGEARWVGGECLTFKVRGVDSQGAVAIVESTVQPGYAPPPGTASWCRRRKVCETAARSACAVAKRT